MLDSKYLTVGLLGIIILLLTKQNKKVEIKKKIVQEIRDENNRKPNLILKHYPSHISHLNYYPFHNSWSFQRHHRFHGEKNRSH